jgi:glutamate/tyrosine decarboxylase-like PLP-dependent enzyme
MNEQRKEVSLDPSDWSAMRALAHRAVDDAIDYLATVRDRPVWQPTPDSVIARLHAPLPREPQGAEQAYADFRDWVMPYQMGNTHPRFWSWYMGGGTAFGAIADFLASTVNPNMGGGNHVANYVEGQVVDWCKDIVGLPRESGGLLVSGASMANFVALAVARNATAGVDLRAEGVAAMTQPPVFYASTEVHSCIQKAIELLGLGKTALRKIPVDASYRFDLTALEREIAVDRAAGRNPVA